MLAEKFFLYIVIKSQQAYADGSPRVVSSSPHVPVICRPPGHGPDRNKTETARLL
jgi:hypothetical protein